jgi:hypothetical protein
MAAQDVRDAEALGLMGLSFEKAWQEVVARNIPGDPTALRNMMASRIKSAVLIGVRDVDRLAMLAIDTVASVRNVTIWTTDNP